MKMRHRSSGRCTSSVGPLVVVAVEGFAININKH